MGKRVAKVEIYDGYKDKIYPMYVWRWRLRAGNGEIVCHSEAFTRKSGARRAAKRFLDMARTAVIVEG